MRIAFHTPLNPFDDGRISGDRRMARQIADGLARLGHQVEPLLDARSYMTTPADLEALKAKASARVEALVSRWREADDAPQLWFTYHSYYKAPDLLGPAIAGSLGIPYVVAEASDSRRRADGEWADAVAQARASFAAADLHLCFTGQDRASIEPWLGADAVAIALPPFIAARPATHATPGHGGAPRLVTVAMMRSGVKHESYLALARTLGSLLDRPWTLTIIGDGPLRGEVAMAFAALPPDRLVWRGALAHQAVAAELPLHDIFVWPGLGEAYGLVYLEAQAAGLPVVAFASGGVPDTLQAGETAFLAPERDEAALAEALGLLLDDRTLRTRMGAAAARFIASERDMDTAAARLAEALSLAEQAFRRRKAILT